MHGPSAGSVSAADSILALHPVQLGRNLLKGLHTVGIRKEDAMTTIAVRVDPSFFSATDSQPLHSLQVPESAALHLSSSFNNKPSSNALHADGASSTATKVRAEIAGQSYSGSATDATEYECVLVYDEASKVTCTRDPF